MVSEQDVVTLVCLGIRLHADQNGLDLFNAGIGRRELLLRDELGAQQGDGEECQSRRDFEDRVEVFGDVVHGSRQAESEAECLLV